MNHFIEGQLKLISTQKEELENVIRNPKTGSGPWRSSGDSEDIIGTPRR